MQNSGRYVSVQLLNFLLAYASSNQYDVNEILKVSGIEPEITKEKKSRLDMDQFCAVVSSIKNLAVNSFSGLHLAEKVNVYGNNHILMSIMSHCSTLEKAIEKLIKYHDISSNSLRLHSTNFNSTASLVWKLDMYINPDLERIFVEAALASCAIMFRDLTMGKAKFVEINFIYPQPSNLEEYEKFFGCPVLFDKKENKINLKKDTLSLPITMSDPELLAILEQYAQKILSRGSAENVLSEKILLCLEEMIIQGKDYQILNVANKMSVSTRTLQKQLKQENITYRKLLEKAKKGIAVKSLAQGNIPLVDITFLLGFSEQSALNHAFKRWTGLSPRKFFDQKKMPLET